VSNPDFAEPYRQPPDAGRGYRQGPDARAAGGRGARPRGGHRGDRGMTNGAGPGQAAGPQWQAGRDPGGRQGRPSRRDRDAGSAAAPGRYGRGPAARIGGPDDPGGYAGPGAAKASAGRRGTGGSNGYAGRRGGGYAATAGQGGRGGRAPAGRPPAGYNDPAGYYDPAVYDDPAGYAAPGGRGAAGLRERAIDRTGIRQRLAERRADPGYGGGPGGPGGYDGGRPPRVKGSWWRHWTWRKALAVATALGASVMVIAVIAITVAYSRTPVPTQASEAALQQSSVVYFSNGKTQVGTFSTGTNRQMLASNQIPAVLKQAVIAAEDRHFYTEGGVSPTGILRAAYQDLTGGQFQGGSTITQQFARNYYSSIGTSQTLSRKLKEIFVAIKLAHSESKDSILTQYLNTIYLGDNAYGVGAAAQTYFGKPASKLDLAQSAMLAAMINEPGFFNPTPRTPGYAPLVARWKYVLTNMVRDGAITQQQLAKTEANFPKIVKGQRNSGWTGYRGYIMQAVETELETRYHYTSEQIFTGGLKVVTTFSQPMMRALYQVVTQKKREMAAGGRALPRYAHIGAVLQQPRTGAILAMYGGPNYGLTGRRCRRIECQYNMALQSRNQVGSSFKPYVLATAVSQGMNVKTSVLDGFAPLWIPPDSTLADRMTLSSTTRPANPVGWYNLPDPNENYGPISVAKAAALSSNSAFADLAHRVGTRNVVKMAAAFGVNAKLSGLVNEVGGVGMALGQASLTVAEQANTFATFAAGGVSTTQHVISKITSPSGPVPLKILHNSVLQPGQAADIDYALSFDTKYGTGTNAAMPDGRPIIGKTGTTNTAQSAFFIGGIPQFTLAVGIFTQNQSDHTSQTLNGLGGLSQGGYGGTWPAMIWRSFADREFAQLPIKQFPVPPFTGSKWIQVPRAPKHHQPAPAATPPPGRHCKFFGRKGCPTPTPIPTPTPTPTPSLPPSPGPSPSPTCTTPGNCKVTGGG
jgi:membrane peptidoglycan carboxypeptidase